MTSNTANAVAVTPGSFEPERHYYPRVLNAHIHPLVRHFCQMGNEAIASRFCHLHPEANAEAVRIALATAPERFRWGGADLFQTTTETGRRQIVLIETNSSPSGQKSMPPLEESQEMGGYQRLLERAFLPSIRKRPKSQGVLAVLHDKNLMECSGYAAAMAELTGETVFLAKFMDGDPDPPVRFGAEGVVEVRDPDGAWRPVRGAVRYVTQRPWNRIPVITRPRLFNSVLVCLAGGRNKLLAAKAYDLFNADMQRHGLEIRVPETIWDVPQAEVPLWVQRMGGYAVVKNPYSNAGQGVYPITNEAELDAFGAMDHPYDRFIVQALIGNVGWSSTSRDEVLYHVGTVPGRKRAIYVADIRCMVGAGPDGFFPVAIYARRARSPLAASLEGAATPWEMLGTNLSVRDADGAWGTEPERLMLMDSRDFNWLGIGLDDLIECYLQTILSMTAIDRMANTLITTKRKFRRKFFGSINPDPALVQEIRA
ncbi:MAG: ATP-grasp domain-containing protein [Planctomycetota bacterium]